VSPLPRTAPLSSLSAFLFSIFLLLSSGERHFSHREARGATLRKVHFFRPTSRSGHDVSMPAVALRAFCIVSFPPSTRRFPMPYETRPLKLLLFFVLTFGFSCLVLLLRICARPEPVYLDGWIWDLKLLIILEGHWTCLDSIWNKLLKSEFWEKRLFCRFDFFF